MSTTTSSNDTSLHRQSRDTEAEGALEDPPERLSERLLIRAAAVAGQTRFWGPAAPKDVDKDPENDWKQWRRHLRKRKSPLPLEQLALPDRKGTPRRKQRPGQGAPSTPLAWGISRFLHSTASLLAIVDALAQNRQRKGESSSKKSSPDLAPQTLQDTLTQWLEMHEDLVENNNGRPHPGATHPVGQMSNDTWPDNHWPITQDALSCLAVAHALPSLAEIIPMELWWQLLDALWRVVESSANHSADCELPADQSLAGQLLASELPLTLAYLFPEIRPLARLRKAARDSLSAGLLELLNGEGLPAGCQLPILRPLLACWTRCLLIGQTMNRRCWNRKAQNQYLWLARQALRYSAPDGRPLLASRSCQDSSRHDKPRQSATTPVENVPPMVITPEKWSPEFLRAVISLGGDDSDLSAARELFGKKMVALLDQPTKIPPPQTSDHCEWSGLAVMRTTWSRKAPIVAIDFSTPELKIEILTGGDPIVAGVWSSSTALDGKQLEQVGQWEVACWSSDEDVDYLELSMDMTDGVRLERKIVLAREDLFLLLTDSILTASQGKSSRRAGQHGLVHTSRLPLAAASQWIPAEETREGLLATGSSRKLQPLARVFPLALPEWRIDSHLGELTCETSSNQQALQWAYQTPGRHLASPVFLDLNCRRAASPCTWRQLTVAQALEIQPAEVAVGYRIQCAKMQWLIYQSLAPRANRTLLGHNLASEYLVGRFLATSGEVDELLEIED
jgi:hypothetical protein